MAILRFQATLRTYVLLAGLMFLLILPAAATVLKEPFYIGLFSRILIYALAAASLNLILGYGGMVSFGHAAFFGAGAYVVGILAGCNPGFRRTGCYDRSHQPSHSRCLFHYDYARFCSDDVLLFCFT